MPPRSTDSDSSSRPVRRRRRARHRRQIALLVVAGLAGAALVAWAVASGSGHATHAAGAQSHAGAAPTTPATTSGQAAVAVVGPVARVHLRWSNPEPWTGAPPAVLITRLATDTQGDAATVAWFRSSRTQLALYPGTGNPGPTTANRGPEEVPAAARGHVVATFNSGFYEKDAPAGFYTHGTLYHPMLPGLATVVAYSDGTVDIVRWSGGARPGSGIVMARQNLGLLVNDARISPVADILSDWGITWKGGYAVWRSAIGVDRNGNLLYAAGPAQTVSSLARVMVDAGAVRAMQLDINPEWPILVTFGRPGAGRPVLVTPNPNQIPSRFLYPSLKDFFAVYLRTTPGVTAQPW